MTTKPALDTKAHLEWLVERIEEASTELNTPIMEISRSVLLEWSQGTNVSISKRDVAAHGGYTAIRQYANDLCGQNIPTQEALGTKREVAQRNNSRRALERMVGDTETITSRMFNMLAKCVAANPPKISNLKKRTDWSKPAKRHMMLHISDTHFGLTIDPHEVIGGRYDWPTAARRMGYLCHQVAECADDNTELTFVVNGDIIEGTIHDDDRGQDMLTVQIDGTRQILTAMIDYLRLHFQRIRVVTQSGNHDRWPWKGAGRPTAQKYDSSTVTIMRGIEEIFRTAEDVTFVTPKTNFTCWTVGRWNFLATHGDDFFEIGNPSRSIEIAKLADKARRLEDNNQTGGPVDVVLMGHWHFPLACRIPGKKTDQGWLVVNGCASGKTAYTVHIGVSCVSPVQTFWEVRDDSPVYNFRMADLHVADDNAAWNDIVAVPAGIGQPLPKIRATSEFHKYVDQVERLAKGKRR